MNLYEIIYSKISEMIVDVKDLLFEVLILDMMLLQLEFDSFDYVELMVLVKCEFNVMFMVEMFMKKLYMIFCDLSLYIDQEMVG